MQNSGDFLVIKISSIAFGPVKTSHLSRPIISAMASNSAFGTDIGAEMKKYS
jgi:hypothetical protein